MKYASIPHTDGEFILRSLQESDIPAYVDYWFGPNGALVRQAMDPALLGTPEMMRQRLEKRLAEPAHQSSFLLILEHQGQTMGYWLLKDFTASGSAGAHVHFFDPKKRGRGYATALFWEVLKIFFENHAINKIQFEPPQWIPGSNALLKKMGIRFLGSETKRPATNALEDHLNCFEITREEWASRIKDASSAP